MFCLRLTICSMGLVMMACLSASDGLPEKFDVTEKSIRELSSALDSGSVTSLELVDGYLSRIREYDGRGPMINAMIHPMIQAAVRQ